MYKRILMAYDGTLEGQRALREGGLLARQCGAQVFLLAVTPAVQVTESLGVASSEPDMYERVLRDAVAKAKSVGVEITAKISRGEPSREITAFAKEVKADLIILSHRKKSFFERWWAGPDQQTYLVDNLDCSLLIARTELSDEEFMAKRQEVLDNKRA